VPLSGKERNETWIQAGMLPPERRAERIAELEERLDGMKPGDDHVLLHIKELWEYELRLLTERKARQ